MADDEPIADRPLTYGERAVGLTFNPGGDKAVHACKAAFAAQIDLMDELRRTAHSDEQARYAAIAITEMQTAQMWAVKALTFRN